MTIFRCLTFRLRSLFCFLIAFCPASLLLAQDNSSTLEQQRFFENISLISQQFDSRVGAEKKLSPNLAMEVRRAQGDRFLIDVMPEYDTGIDVQNGAVKVLVFTTDRGQVVALLEGKGASVIQMDDNLAELTALIPLTLISEIAALDSVAMIHPAAEKESASFEQDQAIDDGSVDNVLPNDLAQPAAEPNPFAAGEVDERALDVLGVTQFRLFTEMQRQRNSEVSNVLRSAGLPDWEPLNGKGQKVCVVSSATQDGLADAIERSELPVGTRLINPLFLKFSFQDDEGIALAEIVHDVAPGAEILIASLGRGKDLADVLALLVKENCDVIVDDIESQEERFVALRPTTVDAIYSLLRSLGAIVIRSAGNNGNRAARTSEAWMGDFTPATSLAGVVPAPGFEVHAFSSNGTNPRNVLQTGDGTSPLDIIFEIAHPLNTDVDFDGSDADKERARLGMPTMDFSPYRICVENPSVPGGTIACEDIGFAGLAIARIDEKFNRIGTQIVLMRKIGEPDFFMRLKTQEILLVQPERDQRNGSITKSEADYLVGAVDVNQPNNIEDFSSDLGLLQLFQFGEDELLDRNTSETRAVSQGVFSGRGGFFVDSTFLLAVDRVKTTVPGFGVKIRVADPSGRVEEIGEDFPGTSAAAPHLAGIVAVLLQQLESPLCNQSRFSLDEKIFARETIRSVLINSAVKIPGEDVSRAGQDRMGEGRVNLDNAGFGMVVECAVEMTRRVFNRAGEFSNDGEEDGELQGDFLDLLLDEIARFLAAVGLENEDGRFEDAERDDILAAVRNFLNQNGVDGVADAIMRAQITLNNADSVSNLIQAERQMATTQLTALSGDLDQQLVRLSLLPDGTDVNLPPELAGALQGLQTILATAQNLRQQLDQVDPNSLSAISQLINLRMQQVQQLLQNIDLRGLISATNTARIEELLRQRVASGDPLIRAFLDAQIENLRLLLQQQTLLTNEIDPSRRAIVDGVSVINAEGPTGENVFLVPDELNVLASFMEDDLEEFDFEDFLKDLFISIIENPDSTPMNDFSPPSISFSDFRPPPPLTPEQEDDFDAFISGGFGISGGSQQGGSDARPGGGPGGVDNFGGALPQETFLVPYPIPGPESIFCPIKEVDSARLQAQTLFLNTPNDEPIDFFVDDAMTQVVSVMLTGSRLVDIFLVPDFIQQAGQRQFLGVIPPTRFVPDEAAMGNRFLSPVILDDRVARTRPFSNGEAVRTLDQQNPLVNSFEAPLIRVSLNNDADNPTICSIVATESLPEDYEASCRSLTNPIVLGMETPYTIPSDLLPLAFTPGVNNDFFNFDIQDFPANFIARDLVRNLLRRNQLQAQFGKSTHNKHQLLRDLMDKAIDSSAAAEAAVARGDMQEALAQAELTNIHSRNACRAYSACVGNYLGIFPAAVDANNDGIDDIIGQPFSRAQRCSTYPDQVGLFGGDTDIDRADLLIAPATFGNAGRIADNIFVLAATTQEVVNAAWNKDTDGDGQPDFTDPDRDGDGVPNNQDPLPDSFGTADSDGDGIADEVDLDANGDGILDVIGDVNQIAADTQAALAALDAAIVAQEGAMTANSFPFNADINDAAVIAPVATLAIHYAAFDNGNGVIAYTENNTVRLRFIDINGQPMGSPKTIASDGARVSDVAVLDNGNLAVALEKRSTTVNDVDGFLQLLNPQGGNIGNRILLNQYRTEEQRDFKIVAQAGGFMASYVSTSSDGRPSGVRGGLFVRRFNNAGQPLMNELKVDGFDEGGFACLDASCQTRVTAKLSRISGYDIAELSNGNVVLAYRASNTGRLGNPNTPAGTFFIRLSSFGLPIGQERLIFANGGNPGITALNNGGFAVAAPVRNNDIQARLQSFNGNGQAQGVAQTLEDIGGGNLSNFDLQTLSDGSVHTLITRTDLPTIANGQTTRFGQLQSYITTVNSDGSLNVTSDPVIFASQNENGRLIPQSDNSALLLFTENSSTTRLLAIRPEGVSLEAPSASVVVNPAPIPLPPLTPASPPVPLTLEQKAAIIGATRMIGM